LRLFFHRPRKMQRQLSGVPAALAAAAVCGGVSVMGWAPLGLWPLALLGYAALLLLLRRRGPAAALALGLAFGLGLHLVGHGWVFSALHDKAGLGVVAAASSTLFFACYLALFTAVPCALFVAIRRGVGPRGTSLPDAALFASLIAAGEYARGVFFNGFTSLSVGYALVDTWFAGLAPVGGVALASWAGLLCAAWVAPALLSGGLPRRDAAGAAAVVAASFAVSQVPWTQPLGSPLSFRLLQVNVPQREKFDPDREVRHVRHLVRAIEAGPAGLIVTPETAFPQFLDKLPPGVLDTLQSFSRRSGSHLLLGIATTASSADGHNSMVHLAPEAGSAIAQYHKVRLMPFGEYSPWGFGWFTRSLAIPWKDLSPGSTGQPPFAVRGQRVGTLICHEDLVGGEARRWLRSASDVSVLVNPSNLAWFERSLAIEQRLQVVQMRAREVARPVLRVANTGVTAHIDERGRVIDRLPAEREGVLAGRVQGRLGLTPYARVGDLVFLLALAASAASALLSQASRRSLPWLHKSSHIAAEK
jgi:apolipoprotein N-acyltransferase